MRTVYVSELLAEANCEKCEDKSCDRCIMKEVLKELQEGNISASADGGPRSLDVRNIVRAYCSRA